jgi:hypothetical protein
MPTRYGAKTAIAIAMLRADPFPGVEFRMLRGEVDG